MAAFLVKSHLIWNSIEKSLQCTGVQELCFRCQQTIVETHPLQGSVYYQSKQCTITGGMPQNHRTFAVFDPPQIGNLMTPAL